MDPRNRSAGQSDFVPVPSQSDFGDAPFWSPYSQNGSKIDPYSATMLYGQPWNGGNGQQMIGINDPRPQDPRVAANAMGAVAVNNPTYDYGDPAVNYYRSNPDNQYGSYLDGDKQSKLSMIMALLGRK